MVGIGVVFLAVRRSWGRGWAASFCRTWRRAILDSRLDADDALAAGRRGGDEKMRLILLKHPEVITVVSQHGRPDDGSDASPFSNVELFVPLKPYDEWPKGLTKDKLTEQIQAEFENELPGVTSTSRNTSRTTSRRRSRGSKAPIRSRSSGPISKRLTKLAAQVRDEMSQVRGVADLGIFPVLGQPNLNIKVDRAKAARYGLNSGDVNTVIQAAHGRGGGHHGAGGRPAVQPGGPLCAEYRDSIEKIRNIKVGYQTAAAPTPTSR
jgi:heavy metal efflux system protein